MSALSRVPCPRCAALNFAQDPVCLGCGCRFTAAPRPAPVAAVPKEQYAPDEMCTRCYGVLLPAAQFDTSGLLGGVESRGMSLPMGAMAAREVAGAVGFLDMVSNIVIGSIEAKLFDRRLRRVLKEAPLSLCCPSCRRIVRR